MMARKEKNYRYSNLVLLALITNNYLTSVQVQCETEGEFSQVINEDSDDLKAVIGQALWEQDDKLAVLEVPKGQIDSVITALHGEEEERGKFLKLNNSRGEDLYYMKRSIYNTSVLAFIPMLTFALPTKADIGDGSSVDLANQAIYALFTMLSFVALFMVPVLMTGTRPPPGQSRSLNLNSDRSFFAKVRNPSSRTLNFMHADISHQIWLEKEPCLQNIICEAQRFPSKYPVTGLPFRILFPASTKGFNSSIAEDEGPYIAAANFGKFRKEKCKEKYKCFFDVLDLIDYFLDVLEYAEIHPKFNLKTDLDYGKFL